MQNLRRGSRARVAAVGFAATGALLLAGCGAANETAPPASGGAGESSAATVSGQLTGVGASSQGSAMDAWIAGFQTANPDATVSYDPAGSGAGRRAFIAGGATAFAGSDAALGDDELPMANERCGGSVVELPLYISPIAVLFNLEGVDQLNMAPATIASIFRGDITNWNAPEIAADNPGVTLPDVPIAPVHRSDDSGTTENFTEYLQGAAPAVWTDEPDGVWPLPGGEAAQGTSGLVSAVEGGNGTVGYADASRAGELGVVQVKVGEAYVGPTPEAAGAVFEASTRVEGRGDYSFAYELARDTTAAGTYPVVLVTYTLACNTYTDPAQGALAKAFITYVASAEGQEAAAGEAGSAPIPDSLRTTIQAGIDAINAG